MAYVKNFWTILGAFFASLFLFFTGNDSATARPIGVDGGSGSTDDVFDPGPTPLPTQPPTTPIPSGARSAPSINTPSIQVDLGGGELEEAFGTDGQNPNSPADSQGDPESAEGDKDEENYETDELDAPEGKNNPGDESEVVDSDKSDSGQGKKGPGSEEEKVLKADVEKTEQARKERAARLERESKMLQKALSESGLNEESKGCLPLVAFFAVGSIGFLSQVTVVFL